MRNVFLVFIILFIIVISVPLSMTIHVQNQTTPYKEGEIFNAPVNTDYYFEGPDNYSIIPYDKELIISVINKKNNQQVPVEISPREEVIQKAKFTIVESGDYILSLQYPPNYQGKEVTFALMRGDYPRPLIYRLFGLLFFISAQLISILIVKYLIVEEEGAAVALWVIFVFLYMSTLFITPSIWMGYGLAGIGVYGVLLYLIFYISLLICYLERNKEIGGWLLVYYFYTLTEMTAVIFGFSVFFKLMPLTSTQVISLLINLFLAVPIYIISIMVLFKKHRKWEYINYLRLFLLGKIFLSLFTIIFVLRLQISLQTNSVYLIRNFAFNMIWLLYFSYSKRIRRLFGGT